jgi:hypothetical protein
MDPALDERRGDQRRGATHRARRVDPQDRLADTTQGIGQVQLGHHEALEEVWCLADNHGVDVGPAQACVLQRTHGRLPDQAGHGDVATRRPVVGLSHPEDRRAFSAHRYSPSMTQTRFC